MPSPIRQAQLLWPGLAGAKKFHLFVHFCVDPLFCPVEQKAALTRPPHTVPARHRHLQPNRTLPQSATYDRRCRAPLRCCHGKTTGSRRPGCDSVPCRRHAACGCQSENHAGLSTTQQKLIIKSKRTRFPGMETLGSFTLSSIRYVKYLLSHCFILFYSLWHRGCSYRGEHHNSCSMKDSLTRRKKWT